MRLRAGVVSDCGHVRSANEDSFLLRPGLYAVCDGMGGARAGEVASQMACLGLLGVDPSSARTEELRRAIVNANKSIVERSTLDSDLFGMGTTITAALLAEDGLLVVAHVGDSRAYLLHDGQLEQLTADHSWVGEMVRRGELTPQQAARHPHRSVITKALGTDMILEPDLSELRVVPGDRVLLCSDGLTGMVSDKAIAGLMGAGAGAQATAQSLVEAALENGGEDNVTVVVVDVESSGTDDAGQQNSWADSRIIMGPENREASRSSEAPHGRERLSLAAREKLRRRAQAATSSASSTETGESSESREELAGTDAGKKALSRDPDGSHEGSSGGSVSDTVPAPTAAGHRKKRGDSARNKKKGRRKWLLATVITLLVLVIAVGGFAWYNSTVYYLGDEDGKVALYRGLPWEFLGIEFYSVYAVSPVEYRELSAFDKTRVDSHELLDKEKGKQLLDGLSTGS